MIPTEEAVQEYKNTVKMCLESLREKLEDLLKFKCDEEKKAEELRNKTDIKRQKIQSVFEELQQFLNKEKQITLLRLEEEEKKILKRIGENMTQLEEQSSFLMHLISEIEEKSQQPTAELLKDVKDTLSRWQNVTLPELDAVSTDLKVNVPLRYPQRLKKSIIKFRDWWMEYGRYAVDVTLDPETAHSLLILSEDRKSVRLGDTRQNLPDIPQRFDYWPCVLGCESFTAGRHYWEVEVGHKTDWELGVCADSVSRKGLIILSAGNGYWAVALRNGDKYWTCTCPWWSLLLLRESPRAVGIFLDYEAGKVSFYNADTKSHLYTFTHTFTEKLQPYFYPGFNKRGTNAEALRVRPVPDWE